MIRATMWNFLPDTCGINSYVGSGEDSTKGNVLEMSLCEDKRKFTWQKIQIRTF